MCCCVSVVGIFEKLSQEKFTSSSFSYGRFFIEPATGATAAAFATFPFGVQTKKAKHIH